MYTYSAAIAFHFSTEEVVCRYLLCILVQIEAHTSSTVPGMVDLHILNRGDRYFHESPVAKNISVTDSCCSGGIAVLNLGSCVCVSSMISDRMSSKHYLETRIQEACLSLRPCQKRCIYQVQAPFVDRT
mgnify:CR=1 FL=1